MQQISKSVDDDDDHEKLFLRPRAKRSSRSKTITNRKFRIREKMWWARTKCDSVIFQKSEDFFNDILVK